MPRFFFFNFFNITFMRFSLIYTLIFIFCLFNIFSQIFPHLLLNFSQKYVTQEEDKTPGNFSNKFSPHGNFLHIVYLKFSTNSPDFKFPLKKIFEMQKKRKKVYSKFLSSICRVEFSLHSSKN